ncbi:MAG: glutamate synthase subunit alpha [Omnitrophica WOR_2 bacterium GWF2_38_59]|nr:MAG: glutamate synthase subunit alpha [Omnitrophica WOR_2 bacterium GWF2_38_59]OGX50260.1 MAG: glutamate synthase subunit alpha [Omnitrophica WOR_2 bacterium RIFOXYA2_FULL_38_17]HBG61219.1 glutamate synthase large subunit [Candidatus Omnitrophota bacterium]
MENHFYPKKQGLYDPAFEHDSCGVGFVAHLKGKKSHKIICDGIQILENLTHRGATGSDPLTGDGAGILIQMPDAFLRKECTKININLPPEGDYAIGNVFLPHILFPRNTVKKWFSQVVKEEGQEFLGWRDVPCDNKQIGRVAASAEPTIRQVIIGRGKGTSREAFDRKLYVIRKILHNKVWGSSLSQRSYCYCCSLSSKTLLYKGQLMSEQVALYYKDLADTEMVSALAMVHSRYSTNTFPSWALAQPFRMICHNGEINTLRSNFNWMRAREHKLISNVFGEDIKKIFPISEEGASDSAVFDNTFELMVLAGRPMPHVIMMMIPEAWSGHESMPEQKKAFYEYNSCLMEPWDGPASIAFTDGKSIGAVLDRNGLRPSRYLVTKDDYVVMASETGVLDIAPENVILKGRLQPGKVFLVDTEAGRIIDDTELKNEYISKKPYAKWLKENVVNLDDLPQPEKKASMDDKELFVKQKAFGYTTEFLKMLFTPMVVEGKEAIGSMGCDTPLAVLSDKPQLLYNYFKQLFAQVTNPPVDPIREEVIMAEDVMLGAEGNLLDETPQQCRRLRLKRPIITNSELLKICNLNQEGLKSVTIDAIFKLSDSSDGIEIAMEEVFKKADAAIVEGCTILVLTDRGIDKDNLAIPSLLACAGLHHHLIRAGLRTNVSIVIETGEARSMHHYALLIGYGANAINPYLVYETVKSQINQGILPDNLVYGKVIENYLKSTRQGLLKIISKMGISTIQSYCGAQIFEAVGLNRDIIGKYFTATPSRIGGIGVKELTKETIMRHMDGYPQENSLSDQLDVGGYYRWRKQGEHHQLNPETISTLQHAVRTGNYELYKKFARLCNDKETNLSAIRGLVQFKKRRSVPIEEVEPVSEIVKRFATGAMSFGSISREAHETLAIAMNQLGGFSNTGEGGEKTERFKDQRRSKVKQVAQGRFGVTIEYLTNADQLQIKMAQGAKPGEGGHLPGHKVSQEIADTRHTTPGVGLISPPPHHDIYSIEDLSQLIHDLKNANPQADISVKLVAEMGVGTVAAGVSKGKADHVLISGYEGGTGASPQTSIKHAGLPMELGIAETQQVLVMNDLRGRIKVQTDGQLRTGRDVVIAGMFGADEFGFATIALVSMGCVMLRKCHLNACSVGIATQDPELRRNFKGKAEHVVNYFTFVAQEVREIMAELGIRKFEDLIGRVDYLETREILDHWKAKGIDLTDVLHQPDVPDYVAKRNVGKQDHGLEKALDHQLIKQSKAAIEDKKAVSLEMFIKNTNRTVGTMLSHQIASRYGLEGLSEDTIKVKFTGSAGQSFGAFLAKGITFELEGDSNDYVGKGLSGGKIIVYPSKKATFISQDNILIGNVVLYGAIMGEAYFRGIAGERFCVRNSGAKTVVEGVGDHGCEYMTGGRTVVLGKTGRNFAAGMSGGVAYVWDLDGDFSGKCNMEMVELFSVVKEKDINELKGLIENHYKYTGSIVAKGILDNWNAALPQFIKVFPVDYRRVLEEEQARMEALLKSQEVGVENEGCFEE